MLADNVKEWAVITCKDLAGTFTSCNMNLSIRAADLSDQLISDRLQFRFDSKFRFS